MPTLSDKELLNLNQEQIKDLDAENAARRAELLKQKQQQEQIQSSMQGNGH
ncbi:hypothetical protein [Pseudomonas sp. NPDC087639]|uniref:hypothetical protein n=1 Tax=Pseudomonas sp. NPDC087639 TaxID=3364445 RepID=UPI0037F2853E